MPIVLPRNFSMRMTPVAVGTLNPTGAGGDRSDMPRRVRIVRDRSRLAVVSMNTAGVVRRRSCLREINQTGATCYYPT